ncbi:MFS multidrug transporter [Diaporthe helianthi]|uniref:MFS multidrug transporter n=1 Tax=Diaporthe helianthi TaxID=158607 RepID=A0A2P5HLG6_DIAHE|nr:MFS multidrug transporter [Diaporthe helianthi]
MLFTEPILISLSLYMAFIYSVLFLDFTAYPIVFQSARGWSLGISGLSFLGIGLGMAIAALLSPLVDRIHARYVHKLGGPASPQPEALLPHLVIISWFLPLGLLWFGWTALPPTPTSALAANTLLRSLFGAVFAIFAKDYVKMAHRGILEDSHSMSS